MLSLGALLVTFAAAPAGMDRADTATAELAAMFVSVCLDGQGTLDAGRIREVDADAVSAFWSIERRQRNARYYKVSKPMRGALVISDYAPANADGFKRTCELITRGYNIKTAWRLVSEALGGKPAKPVRETDIYTIDHPAAGYKVEVRSWAMSIGEYDDDIVRKARSRPDGPKKPVVSAEDSIFQ